MVKRNDTTESAPSARVNSWSLCNGSVTLGSIVSPASGPILSREITDNFGKRGTISCSTPFLMPSGFRDTWRVGAQKPDSSAVPSGDLSLTLLRKIALPSTVMGLYRTDSDSSWTRAILPQQGIPNFRRRMNSTYCQNESRTVRYRFEARDDVAIKWPILTETITLPKGRTVEILPPDTPLDWLALEFCMTEDDLFRRGVLRVVP